MTLELPSNSADATLTTSEDSTTTSTTFLTITSDLAMPTGPIGILPTMPPDADASFLQSTVNQLLGIIQRLMDLLSSSKSSPSDDDPPPMDGADDPPAPVITDTLTLPTSTEPSTTVLTPTDTETAFPSLGGSPYPPITIVLPPKRQDPAAVPSNASTDAVAMTVTGSPPVLTPISAATDTLPLPLTAPPSASFVPLATAASGTAPGAAPLGPSAVVSLSLPSQPPVPTETPPAGPGAGASSEAAKQWARQVWLAIVELLKDLLNGGPGKKAARKGEVRRRGVAGRAMDDAVWTGPGAGRWG